MKTQALTGAGALLKTRQISPLYVPVNTPKVQWCIWDCPNSLSFRYFIFGWARLKCLSGRGLTFWNTPPSVPPCLWELNQAWTSLWRERNPVLQTYSIPTERQKNEGQRIFVVFTVCWHINPWPPVNIFYNDHNRRQKSYMWQWCIYCNKTLLCSSSTLKYHPSISTWSNAAHCIIGRHHLINMNFPSFLPLRKGRGERDAPGFLFSCLGHPEQKGHIQPTTSRDQDGHCTLILSRKTGQQAGLGEVCVVPFPHWIAFFSPRDRGGVF